MSTPAAHRPAHGSPVARALEGLRTVPPGAGAAVMATGILSVGLRLTGYGVLSAVALAVAAALWLVLALAFVLELAYDRAGWQASAANPPALTAVAATCVLGTRLSLAGRQSLALALLAVATAAWPWLLVSVLRHWKRPVPGVAFLVCVATQGLAVLGGTLALAGRGDWLARAALAVGCLGVLLYGEALVRFDFRQVFTGHGDQWVAAGALAISALAASKLVASPLWTGSVHQALRVAAFVLLALDFAWYAVLACAEFVRPRPGYDLRRWSTVFPLGMTAVAGLSTGQAAHVGWLHGVSSVLLWIAVAAWLLTAAGWVAATARRAHTA
ncbi:tellurite resistance/C4-dicarboxylate transporter family protein [Actinacidiphila sp. bgisy145]|uniref:tellurite resistance/C4-dicarboxylate transporter family protein n=1 Tax=Actinacidiphila sp. bgisy145 TaxID=3413792 RepID=UPI003EB76EF7